MHGRFAERPAAKQGGLGRQVVGAVVVDGEHCEEGVVDRIAFLLDLREVRAFGQPSGAALTSGALASAS